MKRHVSSRSPQVAYTISRINHSLKNTINIILQHIINYTDKIISYHLHHKVFIF